jgi:hypothetical protein
MTNNERIKLTMNLKTLFHSLLKHLPLSILILAVVGLWLTDSYADNFPVQRMLHWMSTGPVGWGLAAVCLVMTSLLLYWFQQNNAGRILSEPLPFIRVVVTSGRTVQIDLTEKKYPGESYWSGTATEIDGEIHQLVICQKASSALVIGNQITRSLKVTSSQQFLAEQFNELVRQHKIPIVQA